MTLRVLKLNYIRPYHVIDNDSVRMTRFPGGFLDRGGNAFYYLTDYQSNNIAVVDAGGSIAQRTYYYPYGEPWRYPDGQPYLFSDKELTRADGRHAYTFPARTLLPSLPRWTTPRLTKIQQEGQKPAQRAKNSQEDRSFSRRTDLIY